MHAGATPVFVDVRDDDLNIDPALVREAVTERTKAILPVDLAGQPADLDPLLELGLPIVEDAAHAAEAEYRGRKVGSLVDATCFSLYATKNVAAGEGGIVTTNREDVADAIRDRAPDAPRRRLALRHRRARATRRTSATCSRRSRSCSSRRSSATARSASATSRCTTPRSPSSDGIEPLARDPRDTHALHLYVVRIDPERAGGTRDEYQRALAEENIGTSIHFLPVHQLTWYRERYPDVSLPVAERAGAEVLSLPLSPAHSDDDVEDAIAALRRVHEHLTG